VNHKTGHDTARGLAPDKVVRWLLPILDSRARTGTLHGMPSRATLALLLLSSITALAADWPNFRGPTHDGVSSEKSWKAEWSSEPPVAWKAKVGLGFSSIVVANGRAATAGHADGKDTLFCFDAVSGKMVWQANLAKETEAPIPTWGYTGAPLVQGDLLVVNVGDAGAAVQKATGKLVWKSATKDCGYSTPFPLTQGGKALAVLANADSYVAVDVKTGAEVWRQRWLTQYNVNAANPVISGGLMFLSTGYGKGGAQFKLGPGAPTQGWKTKALRTQMNAAVLHEGHLYGVDGDTTEKATLKCLDFATGKEKWAEPGFGSGGVIVADGQLIALSALGELLIAPATPEGFKPTTRTQVLGPKCWTAPVLANGFIYCRNQRGEIAVVDVRAK